MPRFTADLSLDADGDVVVTFQAKSLEETATLSRFYEYLIKHRCPISEHHHKERDLHATLLPKVDEVLTILIR